MSNRRSSSRVSRQNNNNNVDASEAADFCCLIRVVVCFAILILEILMLQIGYTFTPWFFLTFVLVLVRPARHGDANATRVRQSDPDSYEPTAAISPAIRSEQRQAFAAAIISREKELSRRSEEQDAQEEERLDRILSIAQAIPPDAKPITKPRPKPNNVSLLGPTGRKPLPSDFRQAVTVASLETTEVNAGSRKKVIATDPLNGCYDIQFERGDGRLVNGMMELTFTRGFCGWNIHGTRSDRNTTCEMHGDDEDDDGIFSIQRGFLAQSGRIYWEERRELKPSYNVLVVGVLDADTAGSFHGEWLSSWTREGLTNTRGKFLNFVRRDDDNEQQEKVDALSFDGIV
jgi:hypothetical protein